MSNRTMIQTTEAAELRASHLAQIDALLDETLTCEEKVRAFCAAAGVSGHKRHELNTSVARQFRFSVARICWCTGDQPKSLFANLPDCECPVLEAGCGRSRHPLIPDAMNNNWSPTREVLEAFSQVQIEARYRQ